MKTFVYPSMMGEMKANAKGDCGIRALANTGLYTYEQAEKHLTKHGKKANEGTLVRTMEKAMKGYPFTVYVECAAAALKVPCYGPMTLAQFIAQNPVGTFLLAMEGHAATVINGKLIDTHVQSGQRVVFISWKV